MMEVGVIVDRGGQALYWHLPPGRSQAGLPDSRALWDVLWERRAELGGFAHSHPGRGEPFPSALDRSTFSAIEAALGRRLDWWITSEDTLVLFRFDERLATYTAVASGPVIGGVNPPAGAIASRYAFEGEPGWLSALRRRSMEEESNG